MKTMKGEKINAIAAAAIVIATTYTGCRRQRQINSTQRMNKQEIDDRHWKLQIWVIHLRPYIINAHSLGTHIFWLLFFSYFFFILAFITFCGILFPFGISRLALSKWLHTKCNHSTETYTLHSFDLNVWNF